MKVISQQTEIDITTAVKQILIDNAIELMKQTKKLWRIYHSSGILSVCLSIAKWFNVSN